VYDSDGKDDIGVLKSVLPVMSRYATGYHPISYTVWYEYTKATNKALKQDVDAELQHTERLTATQTYAVYVKHVVDPAERAVMHARTGLLGLVAEVKSNMRDAEVKTAGFDGQLTRFQAGLVAAKSLADLQGNVTSMLMETKKVSETFGKISTQLDESKKEAQRLADELKSVREEALTDSLSGLFNRRGFDVELERMSGKTGTDGALALIMLDIDNFKTVNDTYGHPLGDAVIAAVGQFIRDCVGAAGIAARYGGEEFAVLFPNQTIDAAEKLAQKIRLRVEQGKIKRRKDDEAIGGITISAGVALWKAGQDPASLVDRADKALYAAKHAGRNRVVVDNHH
jgi:diguanylate cyclase